jgi:hypothetical protein
VDVPSFVAAGEAVTGLAYDPYTDHLFLRLAPGNRIRVVDRPDQSIKREFTIPELTARRGGDLAVRPRDGHLFFLCPGERFIVESDRFGKFVHQVALPGLEGEARGLAYDPVRDRLLLATGEEPSSLQVFDLEGRRLQTVELAVGPVESLAYDAANRELYALVAARPAIQVLDEEGRLLRTLPAGATPDFVDLGQRSFVRVF